MLDVIEIDLGDNVARVELDSVERWTWSSDEPHLCDCRECDGKGKVTCEACGGHGYRECNMGHEHDCDECDADGTLYCEYCDDDGKIGDENAVVEITLRLSTLWQCDVTTLNGRVGSASCRDTAQEAFDAAAQDARPRKRGVSGLTKEAA